MKLKPYHVTANLMGGYIAADDNTDFTGCLQAFIDIIWLAFHTVPTSQLTINSPLEERNFEF